MFETNSRRHALNGRIAKRHELHAAFQFPNWNGTIFCLCKLPEHVYAKWRHCCFDMFLIFRHQVIPKFAPRIEHPLLTSEVFLLHCQRLWFQRSELSCQRFFLWILNGLTYQYEFWSVSFCHTPWLNQTISRCLPWFTLAAETFFCCTLHCICPTCLNSWGGCWPSCFHCTYLRSSLPVVIMQIGSRLMGHSKKMQGKCLTGTGIQTCLVNLTKAEWQLRQSLKVYQNEFRRLELQTSFLRILGSHMQSRRNIFPLVCGSLSH